MEEELVESVKQTSSDRVNVEDVGEVVQEIAIRLSK